MAAGPAGAGGGGGIGVAVAGGSGVTVGVGVAVSAAPGSGVTVGIGAGVSKVWVGLASPSPQAARHRANPANTRIIPVINLSLVFIILPIYPLSFVQFYSGLLGLSGPFPCANPPSKLLLVLLVSKIHSSC